MLCAAPAAPTESGGHEAIVQREQARKQGEQHNAHGQRALHQTTPHLAIPLRYQTPARGQLVNPSVPCVQCPAAARSIARSGHAACRQSRQDATAAPRTTLARECRRSRSSRRSVLISKIPAGRLMPDGHRACNQYFQLSNKNPARLAGFAWGSEDSLRNPDGTSDYLESAIWRASVLKLVARRHPNITAPNIRVSKFDQAVLGETGSRLQLY